MQVLQIIQLVKLRRERRRRALNVDEDGNEIFDEEADAQPCAKANPTSLLLNIQQHRALGFSFEATFSNDELHRSRRCAAIVTASQRQPPHYWYNNLYS